MTSLRAPSRRESARRAFYAKWSALDWSKQDVELAAELRLSRERIRQIRQQLGAPKSPHHHRMRKSAHALQWAKENLDKLKELCAAEVGRKYGFGLSWRKGSLYRFLKPFLRNGARFRKHRWDLMNLCLPNRDLQRIWRLPFNMAGSYRYRNQRPPPAWSFKGRHLEWGGRKQLQAYQRAVQAEKRKAARYFASRTNRTLR